MKLTELKNALKCVNIPIAYGPHPEEVAPPYITFNATESAGIYADGMCVYSTESTALQLITNKRDICIENAIERILNANRTPFNKTYEFDIEQKIHTTQYNFAVEMEEIKCQ